MANKLFVAVPLLVLVAGLGTYLQWSAAPPFAAVADSSTPTPIAAEVGQEPAAPVERIAATQPIPTAAPRPKFDPVPPRVATWRARFCAVDADERPVAGATITVWKAKRQLAYREPRAEPTPADAYLYSGHFPDPLLELHTDASGRAEQTFDRECIAAAAQKTGIGMTGYLLLRSQQAETRELKFVLEAPVTIRGQVLEANGAPAAGARVVIEARGHSITQHGQPEDPAAVTADADGRFAVPLQRGAGFGFHAERNSDRTGYVWLPGLNEDAEIVLRFGSGIQLTGVVVDPQGALIGGASVGAWREYHPDEPEQVAEDFETHSAIADARGRFAIDVRHHARYQLIASAAGFANSSAVWVETTVERPVAVASLNLLQPRTLAGVVLHEDGSPWAGARVEAVAETGHPVGYTTVPNRRDRFSQPEPLQVGDDGRFLFAVHPDSTWKLTAWVGGGDERMAVVQKGVVAGDAAVELRFSAADLAGCVVRGTVRRSDGRPLGDWRVVVVHCDEGEGSWSKPLAARLDGAAFATPPLPLGRRVALRVEPFDKEHPKRSFVGDVVPAQVGPFVTSATPPSFEFVLQPFGQLPVRVLTATGEVAHRVRVDTAPPVDPGSSFLAVPVDANGAALVEHCVPGPNRLRVWRDVDVVLQQDVTLTPGLNPEVTIRLPAK